MLVAAFVILAVAVLLGSVLAVLHLQTEGRATPPWRLAALHGLLAISGLGYLALALRGPPRGSPRSQQRRSWPRAFKGEDRQAFVPLIALSLLATVYLI
jgi:hypothetical protein